MKVASVDPMDDSGVFSPGNCQVSNEKNPGCLGYIGDYTTQLYGDYSLISHYKDPY